jgi:hypothetical protein
MTLSLNPVYEDPAREAHLVDQRIRGLVSAMRQSFLVLGDLMLTMEKTRGWLHLTDAAGEPYSCYEAWVQSLPHSRAQAFAAKRIAKELGPLVSREQLEQIERGNMELLRELARMAPRKVTPQVIEAAIGEDYKSFAALVRTEAPIEPRRRLVFNCELSQAQGIEEMLDWAAWELTETGEPVMGREEALEMVLVDWKQDREGKKNEQK